jgi:hypothetical protein
MSAAQPKTRHHHQERLEEQRLPQEVDFGERRVPQEDEKPSKAQRKGFVRRSIELHPEADEMLEILKDRLQVGSQTEVLRKAIQLLAIALGGKENVPTELFLSKNNGSLTKIMII